MASNKNVLIICGTLLLFGGTSVCVGSFLSMQMNRLIDEGIETTATVTHLSTYTSGSSKSRSTNYRVAMQVHHASSLVELIDDTDRETWESLSVGSKTPVVYVPDAGGLCKLGTMSSVVGVKQTASLAVMLGAIVFCVGGIACLYAWWSYGKPTFRQWANGQPGAYGSPEPTGGLRTC